MRKVSFLIAVCLVLSVMIAAVVAQGPPAGGRGPGGPGGAGGPGGGGQRGPAAPAVAPTQPAKNGDGGEADLPLIMQWVTFTNSGMRGKVTAGDAPGVAKDLGDLKTLFTSAQTAFTKASVSGAADLAKAAATAAADAQKVATTSGKVDAATTKAVTDSCGGCHTTYRTKDDSGYHLKK